jgi:hypothetical protein
MHTFAVAVIKVATIYEDSNNACPSMQACMHARDSAHAAHEAAKLLQMLNVRQHLPNTHDRCPGRAWRTTNGGSWC